MKHNDKSTVQTQKKSPKRGPNYGHHSGLHGDARKARTLENKARRLKAMTRWLLKRQAKNSIIAG